MFAPLNVMTSKKENLYLVPESLDGVHVDETSSVGVEEDDGLETRVLCVIEADIPKRCHDLTHHANADVSDSGVLKRRSQKQVL